MMLAEQKSGLKSELAKRQILASIGVGSQSDGSPCFTVYLVPEVYRLHRQRVPSEWLGVPINLYVRGAAVPLKN